MLDLLARRKALPCLLALGISASSACGSRATEAPSLDPSDPGAPNQPGPDGSIDPGGDGDGGSTVPPWEPKPTEPSEDGSEYLFDQDALRTFELTLSEADLAFLDKDPLAEQYVPGSLRFEGEELTDVGIRYKGSVGSFTGCLSGNFFPPTGSKNCPKLNIKVKIDHTDPDAKFRGMKKLLFHAMNLDPSLMRERLGYALFNEMGVHAPRAVHTRLMINGKLAGLFLLVEEVDGRFTRRRFADGGKGNLYKEAWPTVLNEATYKSALETNRDDNPSVDKILSFAQDIADADETELPNVLSEWIDEEYLARYVAVDRSIKHDDGPYHWYCDQAATTFLTQLPFANTVCGNHNYYWYEDTKQKRLWPVAWDLDNSMANSLHFVTIANEWDDLSVSCSRTTSASFLFGTQMPAVCDPLTRGIALGFAERVRKAMTEFKQGPFSEAEVKARIDKWKTQIQPMVDEAYAADSKQLSRSNWELELSLLHSTLSRLRGGGVF